MDELLCNDASYMETLERVKREISGARSRAVLAVNSEVVCMYWRIGKLIDEHSEWGNRFIDSLSGDIRLTYPGIKGFSVRNLKYMLRLAREYDLEFVQQLAAQIPWGHTMYLFDKVGDRDRRDWYMRQAAEHGWSRATLLHQVSTGLFERQSVVQKVTNFDRMLPPADSEMVQEALKDPYIFDFVTATRASRRRRSRTRWSGTSRGCSSSWAPASRSWAGSTTWPFPARTSTSTSSSTTRGCRATSS